MNNRPRTVGTKEGLGVGIIAIGLLMAFLPSASQQIADLDFIESTAFGIMLGATYVLAILVILAGLVVIFAKFEDDELDDFDEAEASGAGQSSVLVTKEKA